MTDETRAASRPPVFFHEMKQSSASAFILAGGKSQRFGSNKAVSILDGKPIISHVIDAVYSVIKNISIIANKPEDFRFLNLPVYQDLIMDIGPLGGIYTALSLSATRKSFIVACDMPGIEPRLIEWMVMESSGYDIVVPLLNGNYEPLHAVYDRSCLPATGKIIHDGGRQPAALYSQVKTRAVTLEEIKKFADPSRIFRNINYRSDLHPVKNN
ncbi:MAG: molybdenum cofactor guanylyltransferase [Spirochaetes bacterium]|jgi:molybdopterin-guanine dinucleotide biosynthesis protein A|nr:molybdenum cofactor guanylyltransferase [Spirochaetota bacterium]